MYAKLEEDFGLATRAMAIYERAAGVVADEDKFEVCYAVVYVASLLTE
jgi:pre-mRNA-splicing factor SYF1